jgi:leucyl-tRNA---protein transferase
MTNGHFAFDATPPEIEIPGDDHPCSYLPDRTARMTYRLAFRLTETRYEHLLERGWRRFGRTMFRPVCAACHECRSIRVDLQNFRASKSQRRCRNRNTDLQLTVQRPTVTPEHLALYNDYHRDMQVRRAWPFHEINQDSYAEAFLEGNFPFSHEFQYRMNGKLVAVGLVDMTSNTMSSIYFVHDPGLRERGPGTYSVLREIAEGIQTGRRWLYMGYYIRDCLSMNYKNRFHPHQILQAYVDDDQSAEWITPTVLPSSGTGCAQATESRGT